MKLWLEIRCWIIRASRDQYPLRLLNSGLVDTELLLEFEATFDRGNVEQRLAHLVKQMILFEIRWIRAPDGVICGVAIDVGKIRAAYVHVRLDSGVFWDLPIEARLILPFIADLSSCTKNRKRIIGSESRIDDRVGWITSEPCIVLQRLDIASKQGVDHCVGLACCRWSCAKIQGIFQSIKLPMGHLRAEIDYGLLDLVRSLIRQVIVDCVER